MKKVDYLEALSPKVLKNKIDRIDIASNALKRLVRSLVSRCGGHLRSALLLRVGLPTTLRHGKHGTYQPAIHYALSKAIMNPSTSQWTTCPLLGLPSTTLHTRSFTYSVLSSSFWPYSSRPCYTSATTVYMPVGTR